MMPYNPITGNYISRTFKQIFPDTATFSKEFRLSDLGIISVAHLSEEAVKITYALLYSRYANSNIASFDENQFKYEVFSKMFMYGPTWFRRLEIQKELRNLDIDELRLGTKAVHNSALNPAQSPSTSSLDELNYINQQNTTTYKKSKADSYATLLSLLDTDVTEDYIGVFKKLFITIVQPMSPLWYVTTPEEQELLNGD